MASETQMQSRPLPYMEAWPPDDTEESVVGTGLHRMTIINLRWGINEVARIGTAPGQPAPWQALSQTIVYGFERRAGSRYKTLPDVFVYLHPIEQSRGSLAVGIDGPPTLVVEVLSESTYDVDLDLEGGKGYSYARVGVQEYLTLDPTGTIVPEQGRAWRLEDGVYRPWERDAAGRWQSRQIGVAIGLQGTLATVYTHDGQRQLHEGEVAMELARRDAGLAEMRRLVDELRRDLL